MSGAKWDMFLGRLDGTQEGARWDNSGNPRGHAPIHLPADTETATF